MNIDKKLKQLQAELRAIKQKRQLANRKVELKSISFDKRIRLSKGCSMISGDFIG